jgi:hypothetical protein
MAKAFNRRNRMGVQYYLTEIPSNEPITEIRTGDKKITVEQSITRLEYSWSEWINGSMIQIAFPYLSADEREFLMTGITADEWDEIFKDKN